MSVRIRYAFQMLVLLAQPRYAGPAPVFFHRLEQCQYGLPFCGKNAVFPLSLGRMAPCRRLGFHLFKDETL